jgi:hypothetical protein
MHHSYDDKRPGKNKREKTMIIQEVVPQRDFFTFLGPEVPENRTESQQYADT